MIGILPEYLNDLSSTSIFKIELKFDRPLVESDLMPATSNIERLCRLETDDGKNVQMAKKAVVNGRSSIEFFFDLKGMKLDSSESSQRCYQIKCPAPQNLQLTWLNIEDGGSIQSPKSFIDEIKI